MWIRKPCFGFVADSVWHGDDNGEWPSTCNCDINSIVWYATTATSALHNCSRSNLVQRFAGWLRELKLKLTQ
jgi:hypothetical protein